jgi:hypothetical protein
VEGSVPGAGPPVQRDHRSDGAKAAAKADLFALYSEIAPSTASVIHNSESWKTKPTRKRIDAPSHAPIAFTKCTRIMASRPARLGYRDGRRFAAYAGPDSRPYR